MAASRQEAAIACGVVIIAVAMSGIEKGVDEGKGGLTYFRSGLGESEFDGGSLLGS